MKLKEWVQHNKDIFARSDLDFLLNETFSVQTPEAHRSDNRLTQRELRYIDSVKRSYQKGMPIAYLLGKEEFFGSQFIVDSATLIPRPETELIVEAALHFINNRAIRRVLDLGCGSGCIALSIEKHCSRTLSMVASDISYQAIVVARKNKHFHKSSVKFVVCDLFSAFSHQCFDLIVSNPPYVAQAALAGSLLYEPRIALYGGEDGVAVIKSILGSAYYYLTRRGFLILEIGYNQKGKVDQLIKTANKYRIVRWIKDYSSHWRGVIVQRN